MKPYVQTAIDQVNTVIYDPDNHFDADQYDRFASFETARDEAIYCLESLIDERDYDDDDHRREVVWMQQLLQSAETIADLERDAEYRRFVGRLATHTERAA